MPAELGVGVGLPVASRLGHQEVQGGAIVGHRSVELEPLSQGVIAGRLPLRLALLSASGKGTGTLIGISRGGIR